MAVGDPAQRVGRARPSQEATLLTGRCILHSSPSNGPAAVGVRVLEMT